MGRTGIGTRGVSPGWDRVLRAPALIEDMADNTWGFDPTEPEPTTEPTEPEPTTEPLEPDPDPEPVALPAAARRRGRPPSRERQVVRRTLAVAGLDELDRELLGAACGHPADDTVTLIMASLDRCKQASAALGLVLDVAGAEPVAAGALSVEGSANRDGFRRAWATLALLSELPTPAPTAVLDAALMLAGAAQRLDAGALSRLSELKEMLQ